MIAQDKELRQRIRGATKNWHSMNTIACNMLVVLFATQLLFSAQPASALERVTYKRSAAREAKPAAIPAPREPEPPAGHIYRSFGERKLQLAMHYPPAWKAGDKRTGILFFSGSHKVQADKDGKLPPLADERARLGLPVVNRGPGGQHHVPLCDGLARRGFVVMHAEYRTRGKDGVLPGEDIADAVSAMRWVRSHSARLGIDPDRVVAAGGSSGAYLAASLFAFEHRYLAGGEAGVSIRPSAIILYSPLVDWLEVGSMSDAFLVVLNWDKKLGAEISPARHWRKECPPTLVMVGTEEPPFATVKGFAEKWIAEGAPMDLFIAEGREHGFFGKPDWLEKTLARTEEFLRKAGCFESQPAGPAQLFQNMDLDGDGANGKIMAETTIIRELIPHIDASYRTIPEKACRVIQGFSMGGFGARKFGSKYPGHFVRAGEVRGNQDAAGTNNLCLAENLSDLDRMLPL